MKIYGIAYASSAKIISQMNVIIIGIKTKQNIISNYSIAMIVGYMNELIYLLKLPT